MNSLNRQDIIESLLRYLPKVSTSLLDLVQYLQQLIQEEDVRDERILLVVVKKIEPLLEPITALVEEIDFDINTPPPLEPKDVIEYLYGNSLHNILSGLKLMLLWIQNNNEPEEKLRESIDVLFLAAQQVIELVNSITYED